MDAKCPDREDRDSHWLAVAIQAWLAVGKEGRRAEFAKVGFVFVALLPQVGFVDEDVVCEVEGRGRRLAERPRRTVVIALGIVEALPGFLDDGEG